MQEGHSNEGISAFESESNDPVALWRKRLAWEIVINSQTSIVGQRGDYRWTKIANLGVNLQ